MAIIKFGCPFCNALHDSFAAATECCPPKPFAMYLCERCEELYVDVVDADICCQDEDDA